MADVHSKEIRSYNMSRVRSKGTKPEMLVRKFLFRNGFRYRLHDKKLPGKPDIVLSKYKTVIFVNGCFWHGHGDCKKSRLPVSNREWWTAKIDTTKSRDVINEETIKLAGWNVIKIWECELKKEENTTLTKLLLHLRAFKDNN